MEQIDWTLGTEHAKHRPQSTHHNSANLHVNGRHDAFCYPMSSACRSQARMQVDRGPRPFALLPLPARSVVQIPHLTTGLCNPSTLMKTSSQGVQIWSIPPFCNFENLPILVFGTQKAEAIETHTRCAHVRNSSRLALFHHSCLIVGGEGSPSFSLPISSLFLVQNRLCLGRREWLRRTQLVGSPCSMYSPATTRRARDRVHPHAARSPK